MDRRGRAARNVARGIAMKALRSLPERKELDQAKVCERGTSAFVLRMLEATMIYCVLRMPSKPNRKGAEGRLGWAAHLSGWLRTCQQ